MSTVEQERIFFAGLIAGAVFGGILAALMAAKPANLAVSRPATQGLELTQRPEESLRRAEQAATDAVNALRNVGNIPGA